MTITDTPYSVLYREDIAISNEVLKNTVVLGTL
jgi:hypothetical protein